MKNKHYGNNHPDFSHGNPKINYDEPMEIWEALIIGIMLFATIATLIGTIDIIFF